jgi:hypothetical protein
MESQMKRMRMLTAGTLVVLAAALSSCLNSAITTGETSPSLSKQGAAGLPTEASVREGRFVEPVQLDGGLLRVDPAPAGTTSSMSLTDAAAEIWASPAVAGAMSGNVLGFGLVTTLRGASNVPMLTAAPAWIGFAWGGVYHCPRQTANGSPSSHPDLPSSGYVAVVIGSSGAPPDLTYAARSSICGGPAMGPTIATATQVLSMPWHQVGAISTSGRLTVRYTLPGCGRPFSLQASGDATSTTISADAIAPDEALPCPSPQTTTQTIDLAAGALPGQLRHGPLGLVRQIQTG